jgi:hypothetical protein
LVAYHSSIFSPPPPNDPDDARYSRGIVFWGGPMVETNGTKEEGGGWGSDPEDKDRKE